MSFLLAQRPLSDPSDLKPGYGLHRGKVSDASHERMKDTFTDANFPKTADGRVFTLGIRPGEVANRIVTVGVPTRAEAFARLLDQAEHSEPHGDVYTPVPAVFRLTSERGFLTITGRFRGIPVSIISIGIGSPNIDLFVRQVRECVEGDLVIVRLGSCGGLKDHPVGTLVLPKACVSVRRNYDHGFLSDNSKDASLNSPAYLVSKLVSADAELHDALANKLRSVTPLDPPVAIVDNTTNASTDSFFSSQGRQTSFPDHNETLIDDLLQTIPGLTTFEMETHHLFHLASVWRSRKVEPTTGGPPTILPVSPAIIAPLHFIGMQAASDSKESSPPTASKNTATEPRSPTPVPTPRIRAAAVQMIFAQRRSQDFISPVRVAALEEWSGRAILEALTEFHIPEENLHPEGGSIWERSMK